jgi:hypothetical protein
MKTISGIEKSSPGSRLSAKEKRVVTVQKQIEEAYLGVAMLLSGIPLTSKDGIALATQIIPISESYASYCRSNDVFLEWMEKALGYSGVFGLIATHGIFFGMVALNHGFNPLGFLGFKPQEKPAEQREPEMSEEQRAAIWINLMQRQEQMGRQLNEGDNS